MKGFATFDGLWSTVPVYVAMHAQQACVTPTTELSESASGSAGPTGAATWVGMITLDSFPSLCIVHSHSLIHHKPSLRPTSIDPLRMIFQSDPATGMLRTLYRMLFCVSGR
jgi:hypothetical protein